MTNYETNEVMVKELIEMLKKYDVFHDTQIFYNGKMIISDSETQELIVKENVDVKDYVEHGNPDMITVQYEGEKSLFKVVNGHAKDIDEIKRVNRIVRELIRLGEKYNRWYELGSNTSLYFVSDEDDVFTTIDKFNFNTEE